MSLKILSHCRNLKSYYLNFLLSLVQNHRAHPGEAEPVERASCQEEEAGRGQRGAGEEQGRGGGQPNGAGGGGEAAPQV